MFEHIAASNLLRSIIPISRFNKGEANKIFEEVNNSGFKVVVKNNKPACVLLAPDKYEELMETIENYALLTEAEKRVQANADKATVSHEAILSAFGINQAELDGIEVEIE